MTRSLRLTDLALVLGLIVLALIVVAKHGAAPASTGPIGPLSVAQATSFFSSRPLAVKGFLVERAGKQLLCAGPYCRGARLAVEGLRGRSTNRAVLLIGVVDDRTITLVRLPDGERMSTPQHSGQAETGGSL
jgi:hypothetical protein